MRRFGMIVSIILNCCVIVACGKDDYSHKYESHSSISSEKNFSNSSTRAPDVLESSAKSKTNEPIIQKNVSGSIYFPEFLNFLNNQAMTPSIETYIAEFKNGYVDNLLADYEISVQSDHYVSFNYSGTVEAVYPSIVRTGITLDVENGNMVSLESVLPLTEKNEKLIKQNLSDKLKEKEVDISTVFPSGIHELLN